MPRLRTLLPVLLLHAVGIGLLIGGCPSNESPSDSGRPDTERRGEREPLPPRANATHTPSREPAGQPARGYSNDTFERNLRPLPPALTEQARRDCKSGLLVDWETREILWEKQADKALPFASLTKMMTALIVAETIERDPRWTWEREVPVTRAASDIGGRQVWLDPRESFTVDELFKTVLVFSANDAAYLLAEAVGDGDVEDFVKTMNRRARRMGLESLRFSNPHGLPEKRASDDNRGNAKETAYLAAQLLEHDRIVRYASTRLDWLRKDTNKPTQLLNSNPLVNGKFSGANGMKTGYTNRSGFCIAATCEREGRTLVAVLLGCPSKEGRNNLVRDLLEWGYSTAR